MFLTEQDAFAVRLILQAFIFRSRLQNLPIL
jgi:hypothetical protein